ncbi:uncharacterized protein LOC103959382 [Pyrus x bretschneideri]|uniref:uncharacterized protein LOC103959382 n=1 Tax=Pyrus x bretschneideri TaxID=225117 RepID=UPI00202E1352|nr:uncharacterized protein LOC103959382 [Pyrus x bretschneideri]
MAWNQIKYSMLNLRSSDFSIREESMDSQILSSPRSLSIASEPSDLKNWFPSYQYESPALKSNSFLDDTVVPETEMEENSGGFERNGTKNEAFIPKNETPNGVVKCGSFSGYEHESHLLSKIPSSLESTSFVSEPTDIRHWYSSYAYESLSLDTIDGVGNSICEVSKHEEDGFLVENNRGKEKVSEDFSINRSDSEEVSGRAPKEERQPVRETPGPLEPPSQLSEPTDIRNWFSSYVYESPSYDTNTTDGFRDPVWKENKSGKDGFLVDNSHRENEEGLEGYNEKGTDGEAVSDLQSEGLAKCITSWRDNKQKTQPGRPSYGVSENLLSQNDLCLKHMPKSWRTKVIAQAQDVEMSILNKESCQCKLSPKTFKGTKIKPSDNEKGPCRNYEKSSQGMTPSKAFTSQENSEPEFHTEVDCISTGSDSDLIPSNGVSERKPTHGSRDRKDDGNEISENGFITTRKGKLTRNNQEKIVERPQEISKMTAPIVVKRKALADATNIHHSPVAGITGKWKCPQKSKPNRGPALKQLRLEKWVRKL